MLLPLLTSSLSLVQFWSSQLPLIPRPDVSRLDWSKTVSFRDARIDNDRLQKVLQYEFARLHARVWDQTTAPLKIEAKHWYKADVGDGFRITISSTRIVIEAQANPNAFRYAISYLARMALQRGQALELPTGVVECIPKVAWRGVHLFVGPNALTFHKKLWTNVLLPLGFNKVVLQCEKTEWNCLPNVRAGINMKRGDLAKLFDWYRSVGVEPIPLVQSFGHADWLFQGKQNLSLALNPTTPYTVDPRKPAVTKLLSDLWNEVIEVTKAKTVHFGLDEIALRGFPKDPSLATRLWKLHIPFLAGIARRQRVQMMLWGDECLSPGQAPNATSAPNAIESAIRRALIPKGSYIADWHYGRQPDLDGYLPTLKLLARAGFKPIACTWYRPDNIRNFILAAIKQQCGALQTTWVGWECSEAVMLKNLKQFSAMVLAADYGWSGRRETPDRLGYDAPAVFLKLYGSSGTR